MKVVYELEYDEEKKIITGRITGELNRAVAAAMASRLAELSLRHGCFRLLNDLREADLIPSVLDIYMIPREVEKAGILKTFKRALLVRPPLDDFRFLETVSFNEGHRLRVFRDPEEALQWLLE
ncbi:MAG: hypothetical protein WC116_08875 [Thermovirgaceae bacterium]|mgnify:FL=1